MTLTFGACLIVLFLHNILLITCVWLSYFGPRVSSQRRPTPSARPLLAQLVSSLNIAPPSLTTSISNTLKPVAIAASLVPAQVFLPSLHTVGRLISLLLPPVRDLLLMIYLADTFLSNL
jgi:hypothetical protein